MTQQITPRVARAEELTPGQRAEITIDDRLDWLRLRESLWPGSLADHDIETRRIDLTRAI